MEGRSPDEAKRTLFIGWRLDELAWDGETVRRVLQLLRRQGCKLRRWPGVERE